MNIYVGNLNYRVKEGDLQQVMEDYGAVSSVKVIMGQRNNLRDSIFKHII